MKITRAGSLAVKAFNDFDELAVKKMNEFSDSVTTTINSFLKQIKLQENDIKFLWKRGNELIIARCLADVRVQRCWELVKKMSG